LKKTIERDVQVTRKNLPRIELKTSSKHCAYQSDRNRSDRETPNEYEQPPLVSERKVQKGSQWTRGLVGGRKKNGPGLIHDFAAFHIQGKLGKKGGGKKNSSRTPLRWGERGKILFSTVKLKVSR